MARGSGSRTWIKLYPQGMLHGSITYQLSEPEQAVWVKLLCFAGEINRDGQISDNDGRPFPLEFIAHEIHTTVERLESTIKRCKEEGRILDDGHGLYIANWKIYQSEYNRQKPYRDKQKKTAMEESQDNVRQERQAQLDNRLPEAEFNKLNKKRQEAANRWRMEHPYD
jgi:hypothetical protein